MPTTRGRLPSYSASTARATSLTRDLSCSSVSIIRSQSGCITLILSLVFLKNKHNLNRLSVSEISAVPAPVGYALVSYVNGFGRYAELVL